jgi:hypothetical protein
MEGEELAHARRELDEIKRREVTANVEARAAARRVLEDQILRSEVLQKEQTKKQLKGKESAKYKDEKNRQHHNMQLPKQEQQGGKVALVVLGLSIVIASMIHFVSNEPCSIDIKASLSGGDVVVVEEEGEEHDEGSKQAIGKGGTLASWDVRIAHEIYDMLPGSPSHCGIASIDAAQLRQPGGKEDFKRKYRDKAPVFIRGVVRREESIDSVTPPSTTPLGVPTSPLFDLLDKGRLLRDHGRDMVLVGNSTYTAGSGSGEMRMRLTDYVRGMGEKGGLSGNVIGEGGVELDPLYCFDLDSFLGSDGRSARIRGMVETIPLVGRLLGEAEKERRGEKAEKAGKAGKGAAGSKRSSEKANVGALSDGGRSGQRLNLMVGPARSGLHFHHHHESWNLLVHGRKLWMFYPPHVIPPHTRIPISTSTVYDGGGVVDWLRRRVSTLQGVDRPIICEQRAGDLVYVPEGWIHAVINTAVENVAVSGLRSRPRKKVYKWLAKGRNALAVALKGTGVAGGSREVAADALTALKMFTKVLGVAPTHQGGLYGKAVAQQQLGLYEAAGYTNAALLDSGCENAEVAHNLAACLAKLGKWGKAVQVWEKLASKDPDFALGKQMLHLARQQVESGT